MQMFFRIFLMVGVMLLGCGALATEDPGEKLVRKLGTPHLSKGDGKVLRAAAGLQKALEEFTKAVQIEGKIEADPSISLKDPEYQSRLFAAGKARHQAAEHARALGKRLAIVSAEAGLRAKCNTPGEIKLHHETSLADDWLTRRSPLTFIFRPYTASGGVEEPICKHIVTSKYVKYFQEGPNTPCQVSVQLDTEKVLGVYVPGMPLDCNISDNIVLR